MYQYNVWSCGFLYQHAEWAEPRRMIGGFFFFFDFHFQFGVINIHLFPYTCVVRAYMYRCYQRSKYSTAVRSGSSNQKEQV